MGNGYSGASRNKKLEQDGSRLRVGSNWLSTKEHLEQLTSMWREVQDRVFQLWKDVSDHICQLGNYVVRNFQLDATKI